MLGAVEVVAAAVSGLSASTFEMRCFNGQRMGSGRRGSWGRHT